MKKFFLHLTLCLIAATALAATPQAQQMPLQYTLSLAVNSARASSIDRELILMIGQTSVGSVRYTISLNDQPSWINTLQVYQEYRGKNGYGKILLYSAIHDIFSSGNKHISLQRYPFSLKWEDNWATRDRQLKAWYQKFGFEEKQGNNMQLTDPSRFLSEQVISSFSSKGITFSFREKNYGQHMHAAA